MPAPEALLEEDENGRRAAARGWFVLNLAESRARSSEALGTWTNFEPPEEFEDYGIGVHVLLPGQPNGLYHEEDNQEDFLVLAGECVAIVEEREHRLKAWDFVHCPRGTRHIFVGAGDGPCAILMVGARRPGATIEYPASDVAARHGAAAPEPTSSPRHAYSAFPRHADAPFPWPPR